jgi:hypothetical protein
MATIFNELKNYQSIPRELIFDSSLSDRARFVFCFMVSKPDNWQFFLEPMAKELGYSVETLRKYIKELVESGWIDKGEQERDKGVFGATAYILRANKKSCTEKADTEIFRHGKNPTQQIKDIKQKKDNNIKNKEKEIDWRTDFNTYMVLVNEAKAKLLADTSVRQKKEKYYPDIDYELSLEKMVDDFWGTEEGWKHKVKGSKKSASIDMAKTLNKGFDMASNRVYKRAQRSTSAYKQTAKPKIEIQRPKDGTNPDGTFNKNGFRYYHSVRDNLDYSIPLNAPAMPSFECEFDCVKQKWYNPNETETTYGGLW